MAGYSWMLRGDTEYYEPDEIYANEPTYFSLEIFHGGHFTDSPGRSYVNGNTHFIDYVDIDAFNMSVLEEMMRSIGYPSDMVFYFHYKVPYLCLDLGLKPLGEDSDFVGFYAIVREGAKLIEVYVEHWNSRVLLKSLEVQVGPSNLGEAAEVLDMVFHEGFNDDRASDTQSDDMGDDPDNTLHVVEVEMGDFNADIDYDVDAQVEEQIDKECGEEDINVDLEDMEINIDTDPTATNFLRARYRVIKQTENCEGPPPVSPFYVGQVIIDKEKITQMVHQHALNTRRQLYLKRNDETRVRIVCFGRSPNSSIGVGVKINKRTAKPTCPWVVQISRSSSEELWCVKTVRDEHKCCVTMEVDLYTISYIAKEVKAIIKSNPQIPLAALQEMLELKHHVQLSAVKVGRAKILATKELYGDYRDQYGRLRDYCLELERANPGSTIKFDVEPEPNPSSPTRQFRRIYICFAALKEGFKICGRQILGLDGCFMKGPYPGQILSAVGIDGNNGIYPLAYALVEAETTQSWMWFLEILGDDLDLPPNGNFTFVSDRQKGLIPALARVFPSAEHRFCVRHIHENMRMQWRGDVFKGMLWKAASATSMPYFNKAMDLIKNEYKKLFDWMMQIPPTSWSRAHFTGRAKCDVLLNNLCEVFNSQLVGARDKPIITCLEYIREYLTRRIVKVKKIQEKCEGPLTPGATKTFSSITEAAYQLIVKWNGSSKYQVNGPWGDQSVVDVEKRTCSCRKWDLTGMPCKHAVATIWDMIRNGMNVGEPVTWVDEVYRLDTWKRAYMCTIDPITSPDMWTPSDCPTTLIPPKHHKQVGRPKKSRKRSVEEIQDKFVRNGKMTKMGGTTKCGKCGNMGHNKRSCKGQGGDSQTSQPTTQGAPIVSQDA